MDDRAEERDPKSNREVVSSSEITTVTLRCDQPDAKYFVGEDAVIKACTGNYSAVRAITWQRKTDTGCHSKIETTLPKYQASIKYNTQPELMIRSLDDSDAGTYFIQLSCTDMEICSNDIFLEVLRGSPKVALKKENREEEAFLNGNTEIKATIRGYPKYHSVIWKKDHRKLDVTTPHYEGSKNDGKDAVLCINDVKREDAGTYTIEVLNEKGAGYSRQTLKVIGDKPEVSLNVVSPVHLKSCVTFEATIRNFSDCHSVIWRKHDQDKDSDPPKYELQVNINQNGVVVLRINDVKKEDAGTYKIEVHNKYGKGDDDKRLEVFGGAPVVTLKKVPLVYFNECVELKAKITGFPKNRKVHWLKDNQKIDMTGTKYDGSNDDGNSAVLYINDVEGNDEAIYTIEVCNELEKVKRSQKLVVIRGHQLFFISGPVVVSPLSTITFHVYLSNQKNLNVEWWKIKGQSQKQLVPDNEKYKSIYEGNNIYKFEITTAKPEDSGAYQCIANNMKSITLYVYVNDSEELPTSGQENVIRFYALQAVSAKAMRKAIDRLPGGFQNNLKTVKERCQRLPKKTWAKEFISINPRNSEDMDISKMYTMYRNLNLNGRIWDKPTTQNETKEADDIERIRFYRNKVCHSDASEIETPLFNKWMLDLLGAIQRLSINDREVIKECCVMLTRVFTTVEFKEKMETFKKEPEKLGLCILNEDEENIENFEEEPEKLDQIFLHEEHHGDQQRTDRSIRRTDTTFHDVCDSSIIISDDCTTATQTELYTGGVCFMNRPMEFGEDVHIRGKHTSLKLKDFTEHIHLEIGLTEIDPDQIRSSVNKKDASRRTFKLVNCVPEENEGTSEDFHLRMTLCQKKSFLCALAICLNEYQYDELPYKKKPNFGRLWLAIDLHGIKSITISNK